MTKAAMTPAERLESARTRKRRVAMLNDVAQKMIVQGEMEEESSSRRHEQALMEERRRHVSILRQAKLDRKAFQDAMDRSTQVMMAAVEALRGVNAGQQALVKGDAPEVSSSSRKKSSRSNAGKKRQRLNL